MMSSKNKAILSFIAVFLVGIAVGVLFENLVLDKKQQNRKRQDPNKFLFEKFTNELSLSTAQQDSLQVLLDDIKEKHRELGKKRHENYERIRSEFDVEFRKILSPEQLVRYDEIIQEFEKKMQQRRNKNRDERGKENDGEKHKPDDEQVE